MLMHMYTSECHTLLNQTKLNGLKENVSDVKATNKRINLKKQQSNLNWNKGIN